MRYLFVFLLVFGVSGAALAQMPAKMKKSSVEKEVVVEQEDGSKIIIQMLPGGGSRAVKVGPDGKVPELPQPTEPASEPIVIEAPEPQPAPAPEPEPEPDSPDARPKSVSITTPDPADSIEKAKEAKPAPAETAPAEKKPVPKKARPAPVRPPQPAPPRDLPPGAAVTADLALQIALDNAPASTSFKVRPVSDADGKRVFAVLFETAEGPYEVRIDGASGDVLSRRYLPAEEAPPVRPGHLRNPPPRPVKAE